MTKILREPLLHFLLLGAALFALHAWRRETPAPEEDAARIDVTAEVVDRLRAGYQRQFNRPPGEEELRGLVAAHIREEILCREALAMGLDRDDTIVRRRLAQKMPSSPRTSPSPPNPERPPSVSTSTSASRPASSSSSPRPSPPSRSFPARLSARCAGLRFWLPTPSAPSQCSVFSNASP